MQFQARVTSVTSEFGPFVRIELFSGDDPIIDMHLHPDDIGALEEFFVLVIKRAREVATTFSSEAN